MDGSWRFCEPDLHNNMRVGCQDVEYKGKIYKGCLCDTDLCNSAPAGASAAFALAAGAAFVAKCLS